MKESRVKLVSKLLVLFLIPLFAVACSSQSNNNDENLENESDSSVDEGEPVQGGSLVLGYPQDVSNYDPIKGSAGGDHALLWPVYDTLITFNPDLEAQPGLAEDWDFKDDETLILKLRGGVRFHDGTPLDAKSVKFNLDRVNSDESQVSDLKNIESVKVVDSLTVELNLKHADTSILLALSDRSGMMVSPTALEKDEENYSQNPVGTGPYKLVERIPNGKIVLEANKDYWEEGKPYLDKLAIKIMSDENTRINALTSGEVDFVWNISPINIPVIESDTNIKLKGDVAGKSKVIYINASMDPLQEKAVRLAIQHGINREALIEGINFGEGEPAYQLFPKSFWAASEKMKIDYNPEKAKQLLKDANIDNVSFTMNHYPIAYDQRIAEALKYQLAEIGIEMNLQSMELTAAVSDYFSEKNTPALLSDWNGRPDPHMTVRDVLSSDSFYNAGSYSTSEIQSLLEEAAGLYDQDERAELYKKITRIGILDEAIIIPLFFNPTTAAMTKNVKGYVPNMYGKPIFSDLWVEE